MGKKAQQRRVASKGHFAVYTADGERFELPLVYLRSRILRELLRMSEDEYGLPGDGPVRLACDAVFMEHAMAVLRGGGGDAHREVVMSILTSAKCGEPLLPA